MRGGQTRGAQIVKNSQASLVQLGKTMGDDRAAVGFDDLCLGLSTLEQLLLNPIDPTTSAVDPRSEMLHKPPVNPTQATLNPPNPKPY